MSEVTLYKVRTSHRLVRYKEWGKKIQSKTLLLNRNRYKAL